MKRWVHRGIMRRCVERGVERVLKGCEVDERVCYERVLR